VQITSQADSIKNVKDSIGILLAGGKGSRLYPLTKSTNKHLMPVYSKPLIYYSLTTLMLAGNREILIVTNPNDILSFKNLLGDGSSYGMDIQYVEQDNPKGLAHALYQTKELSRDKNINLMLGDNIFYGKSLNDYLLEAKKENPNCLFTQNVKNPSNFGVLSRKTDGLPLEIIEKPNYPVSSEAVLGLYFYEKDVFDLIEDIKPSKRGELEITSLNNLLLSNKKVHIQNIGRGISWFDAGTVEDLFQASNFIYSIEKRQDTLISSIEEVAYKNNWIDINQFEKITNKVKDSSYGESLVNKYFRT
tara:strand:+ start:170 stop:1081 length:912 start_codon:yes stop_codon:yes gene_type:complete